MGQFTGLRGKAFVALCKRIEAEQGEQIRQAARELKERDGKFTPRHIGLLCKQFDVPVKTMCEWYLEPDIMPTGTYDLMVSAGLTAQEVLDEAQVMGRKKAQLQKGALCKADRDALDDYKAFRKARATMSVTQSEWLRMSKKTRRALVAMFEALEQYARRENWQLSAHLMMDRFAPPNMIGDGYELAEQTMVELSAHDSSGAGRTATMSNELERIETLGQREAEARFERKMKTLVRALLRASASDLLRIYGDEYADLTLRQLAELPEPEQEQP